MVQVRDAVSHGEERSLQLLDAPNSSERPGHELKRPNQATRHSRERGLREKAGRFRKLESDGRAVAFRAWRICRLSSTCLYFSCVDQNRNLTAAEGEGGGVEELPGREPTGFDFEGSIALRLWYASPCCSLLHTVSPRVTLRSGRHSAVVGWKSTTTAVRVLVAVYERRIDYRHTAAAANIFPESSAEESSLTVRQIMILNLSPPTPPCPSDERKTNHSRAEPCAAEPSTKPIPSV